MMVLIRSPKAGTEAWIGVDRRLKSLRFLLRQIILQVFGRLAKAPLKPPQSKTLRVIQALVDESMFWFLWG
jgi:hypothetical protein